MMVLRASRVDDSARHQAPRHDDWISMLGQTWPATDRWPAPRAGIRDAARCLLRSDLESPRTGRDFTRGTLADWQLCRLAEDATVVVSELVTNAVRHGMRGVLHPAHARPIQLMLLKHDHRLVTVVTDAGDELVASPAPALNDFLENGRGLHVIDAISTTWGWARLAGGGKAVWAAFDTPA
jgi:anti-sigma regulatory factor (Ser/Thr protein kinase)